MKPSKAGLDLALFERLLIAERGHIETEIEKVRGASGIKRRGRPPKNEVKAVRRRKMPKRKLGIKTSTLRKHTGKQIKMISKAAA